MRQFARYGAGRAWLQRRHPDVPQASAHWKLLLAAPLLVLGLLVTGRPERAAFRCIDVVIVFANRLGRLLENRSAVPTCSARASDVAILSEVFPADDVLAARRALADRGHEAAIEADRRSTRLPARLGRGVVVAYREDDGILARSRAVLWLLLTRPFAVLRDFVARPRLSTLRALAPRARRLAAFRNRKVFVANSVAGVSDTIRVARLIGAACGPLPDLLADETGPASVADRGSDVREDGNSCPH